MKKILTKENLFYLAMMSFIVLTFATTGFKNDSYASIFINIFGGMFLLAFTIAILIHDMVSKKTKMVILGFFILMCMFTMFSCRAPKHGCKDSRIMVGYK